MNHDFTKVLIIGVSEFPDDPSINAIPNVLANVQLLKASLTDPDIIGIPESNITLSLNENKGQIERKLLSLINGTRNKTDTLLIYYSGHGILSSNDYKLYLTTHNTTKDYLEIDGLNIDTFKGYIKRSRAERKVVILDCCHSGAFIDQAMSTIASKIQADINEFTGTYIMTSAAGDELSLFPVKSPDKPTYFTGKLIEVLNEGLDNDSQFCSLRDIYDKIEDDFKFEGLPHPQQSNVNDADQLLFAKNKKYRPKKPADEQAWEVALADNTKWGYNDFRKQYPDSVFLRPAMLRIFELEDEESWNKALIRGTLSAFASYLDNFPGGKYTEEANEKIAELRQSELRQNETHFWNRMLENNDIESLQSYLARYPHGRYVLECGEEIDKIKLREEERQLEENVRLKRRNEQEQEARVKEEEIRIQVLEQKERVAKQDEIDRLRAQEMLAYEKKEKELAAKRKELERQKRKEEERKEQEQKNKAAEALQQELLEAERLKELKQKQEEQEAKKLAETKRIDDLNKAKKAQQKKEQEEQKEKENEERIIKEKQHAAQRISEQQTRKGNEKQPEVNPQKNAKRSKELKVTEEDYKENSYDSKGLIILIGVVILVVSIFLYIIKHL